MRIIAPNTVKAVLNCDSFTPKDTSKGNPKQGKVQMMTLTMESVNDF